MNDLGPRMVALFALLALLSVVWTLGVAVWQLF
jgi:hypothetical protein